VQGFLATSGVQQLVATANSPDMNPIERVFGEATRKMQSLCTESTVVMGSAQLKLIAGIPIGISYVSY